MDGTQALGKEVPQASSDDQDIRRTKFKTLDFQEEYASPFSNRLQYRTECLWNLIVADRKGKNEPSWAQCCFSLERKKVKGHLGHPKESVIPIGRFFNQMHIHCKADLYNYFVKHLPFNSQKEIQLPQVNMRHPFFDENSEDRSSIKTVTKVKLDSIDSRILGLEALVGELTEKNNELTSEVSMLRTRLEVGSDN